MPAAAVLRYSHITAWPWPHSSRAGAHWRLLSPWSLYALITPLYCTKAIDTIVLAWFHCALNLSQYGAWCTVYMVIFVVVLFSRISRVRPRETCSLQCLFIVMKTSENREIKLLQISPLSPKLRKYLCAKYMAYVVCYTWLDYKLILPCL